MVCYPNKEEDFKKRLQESIQQSEEGLGRLISWEELDKMVEEADEPKRKRMSKTKKPKVKDRPLRVEDLEGVKRWSPKERLRDLAFIGSAFMGFIGSAFMECLLDNDPEGAMEVMQCYLEAVSAHRASSEATYTKKSHSSLRYKNPTLKTLAKLIYSCTSK